MTAQQDEREKLAAEIAAIKLNPKSASWPQTEMFCLSETARDTIVAALRASPPSLDQSSGASAGPSSLAVAQVSTDAESRRGEPDLSKRLRTHAILLKLPGDVCQDMLQAANELEAAPPAVSTGEREEIARIIAGPMCDATKAEHKVMRNGNYSFCTQCGETIKKPISMRDALNKADAILSLFATSAKNAHVDPPSPGEPGEICKRCRGEGTVGDYDTGYRDCPYCKGEGRDVSPPPSRADEAVAWQMRVARDNGAWFDWDTVDQSEYDLYAKHPQKGTEVRALFALSPQSAPASGSNLKETLTGCPTAPGPEGRWPFVETPGEFADRLDKARAEFGTTLAAVRYVLIEAPPEFRDRSENPKEISAALLAAVIARDGR